MMYYLYKSKTGFKHTAALISKFIRVTVETGLVCATFAILDLSLFLAFKTNNYHLAPSIALSKLYSNSLLAVSWFISFTLLLASSRRLYICPDTHRTPVHQVFNARVRIVGGRNPADSTIMDPSASTSFRARGIGQGHAATGSHGVMVFRPKSTGGINVEISQIRDTDYDAEAQIELTDVSNSRVVLVPRTF